MKRLLLLLALAAPACSGDDPGADDAAVAADGGAESPDGGAAPDGGAEVPDGGVEVDAGPAAPTWGAVQALFQSNCSPCHNPGNVRGRVVVSAYDQIVDQTRDGFTLIAPNDPAGSYVYRKVEGTQAAFCAENSRPTRDCGGVMPVRPRPRLTAEELDLIRGWIEAGAPQS